MKYFYTAALFCIMHLLVFPDNIVLSSNNARHYIEYLRARDVLEYNIREYPLNTGQSAEELYARCDNRTDSMITSQVLNALYSNGVNLTGRAEYSYRDGHNLNNYIAAYLRTDNMEYFASLRTLMPYTGNEDVNALRLKEWNNTGSYIENAYIGYRHDKNYIIAGRFLPAWGIGLYDNLFISDNIYSPDGIMFNINYKFMDFSYYTNILSPSHVSMRYDTARRYSAYHKLSMDIPGQNRLSLKEIVIYNAPQPMPFYLNPFMIYYGVQWNIHTDDNIIWAIEWNNSYFKDILFTVELFVDDFVYEKELEALFSEFTLYAPDKLAVNMQMNILCFSPMLIELEYTRLNNWTGTHRHTENSYMYYNEPMLFSTGPDSDVSVLRARYPAGRFFITGSLFFIRNGEGSINDSFVEMTGQEYELPFPSGIVEYTSGITGDIVFNVSNSMDMRAGAGVNRIVNYRNTQDSIRTITDISLEWGWKF
ncbi:MAG: hypothetical protein R6U31_02790 [bacterium]